MKLLVGLAALGALGAVAPSPALAGSISGTVRDATTQAPIEAVRVCQREAQGRTEESCTHAAANGAYSFDSLPDGSYSVHFLVEGNLNYVDQFYNGQEEFPGNMVVLAGGGSVANVDAALREGGSIAGAVTEAGTAAPVAGLLVCADASTVLGMVGRCVRTGVDGSYRVNGLPARPNYKVEFTGNNELNYLTQYFPGVTDANDADPVTVAVGAITSGVDAVLLPGAEIGGTVTEAGTHRPLSGIPVTLLAAVPTASNAFAVTDAAGHYAFRGRSIGIYRVAFSPADRGFDGFKDSYYSGATTLAEATPLSVAPPQRLTGIDAELVREGGPVTVTIITDRGPPRRCRKGFHRKRVRGKVRCVRKHRHHRHHRR